MRAPRPLNVMVDTLCFHTQQAAEKAIKGVLAAENVSFPRSHDLDVLLTLVPKTVAVPDEIHAASFLSRYSVTPRYPDNLNPATEEEYAEAVAAATAVVEWAEAIIRSQATP